MLMLVICVCLLAGFAEANETPDPSKYSYIILRNKTPVCVGTAIDDGSTKSTIVTAAHCVYNMKHSTLAVSQGKTVNEVHKVLIHPYYMPPLLDYDIALLKIKKSTEKSFNSESAFLEISKEEPKSPNDSLFTVTWDRNETNETSLKVISAAIEERKSCRMKLEKFVTVSYKMLCANFQSIVPNGSPLIYKDKIAGVASYIPSQEILPKIYTNIANSEIFSFIDLYL